jgi:archaellum component FlaC
VENNKNIEDRMERLDESMRDVSDGYERLIEKIDDLSNKIERKVERKVETAARKFNIPDCKYYDIARHVAVETR